MANVSYVFTVGPRRIYRHTLSNNAMEVKAIAAANLEVHAANIGAVQPTTAYLFSDDVRLGTSMFFGGTIALEFEKLTGIYQTGYIGGVTP